MGLGASTVIIHKVGLDGAKGLFSPHTQVPNPHVTD